MFESFGKDRKQRSTQSTGPWALFTNAFLTVNYFEKREDFRNHVLLGLSPWESTLLSNGVIPLDNSHYAPTDGNTTIRAVQQALQFVKHATMALDMLPPALGTAFFAHVDAVLRTHLEIVQMLWKQGEHA